MCRLHPFSTRILATVALGAALLAQTPPPYGLLSPAIRSDRAVIFRLRAQQRNTELFEKYLLKEVMPRVESKYRIAAGRQNRAIAGLSMGGSQTVNVGFSHLDLFSAMGIFSAGNPAQIETKYKHLLSDPTGTNAKLNLLWIGCGDKDTTVQ